MYIIIFTPPPLLAWMWTYSSKYSFFFLLFLCERQYPFPSHKPWSFLYFLLSLSQSLPDFNTCRFLCPFTLHIWSCPYPVLLSYFRQLLCPELLFRLPSVVHVCILTSLINIFRLYQNDFLLTRIWSFHSLAKNGFTASSYSKSGIGKLWPVGQIQVPPVYVKLYWNTATPFIFISYIASLALTMAELGWQRLQGIQILYIWTFTEKACNPAWNANSLLPMSPQVSLSFFINTLCYSCQYIHWYKYISVYQYQYYTGIKLYI